MMAKLVPADQVDNEISLITQSSATENESLWARIGGIFGPRMRLALVVGIIVGVVQQITGINAIFFYAPTIFEQSGIGTDAAFAQAVLVGLINVVFTLVAIALIDRWGRRPLLLVGLSGIAISMALCTYGFSQATYELKSESVAQIQQMEAVGNWLGFAHTENVARAAAAPTCMYVCMHVCVYACVCVCVCAIKFN